MAVTISVEPDAVSNASAWTVTSTNSGETNFRIKAELIIAAATVAVKWQPAGTLSWDFKNILWELITYTTIDFDSLNIQTTNTDSYKSYTVKFTEYWEDADNALVTGDDDTSSAKVMYKVDCTTFADYNLSADDEEFLTERPSSNKIKIGDNLVTGWTNWSGDNAYDTFTSSNRHISSAIDSSASNFGICYTNGIGTLAIGDVIEFYCDFTKNSGSLPSISLIEKPGGGTALSNSETLADGLNYVKLTATSAIVDTRIKILSSESNEVDFSMIKVYTSRDYNELDYLGFLTEEASLRIDYIRYDVDDSSLGASTLSTTSIVGDRGISPVSAILFSHASTQVEKIILKMETATPADRSKDLTFVRNSVCWNNPVRIEWLNKFGAFDAYTFLDNYDEDRSGKRSTYKDTSDVEQILDIENYQVIKAYSNYETKTNLDWIKTILDSEKVYWIVDNERIEIVITGISQVKKKKDRVKLALSFRKLI